MIATTNGYADFLRILLNNGKLNGVNFLKNQQSRRCQAHTQIDNEYGYNGYNLWVTSDKHIEDGTGDGGLWTGGGYEGTHFWIDRKEDLLG